MSPPPTPHPSPTDLANFAQEKLGRKKTQRILDHCKACRACADQLLEAVCDQPIATPQLRLSRWNWISLGFLVIALLASVGVLGWILRSASQPPPAEFEPSQIAKPSTGG